MLHEKFPGEFDNWRDNFIFKIIGAHKSTRKISDEDFTIRKCGILTNDSLIVELGTSNALEPISISLFVLEWPPLENSRQIA